uniref:tubulin-specific chaperone C-like n=1 Tax=Ciona intestinalis TaxID=7719 RepID=UPI000180CE80|nr:tubulin-specific chaperone C-like [Ciona intestinalis]|eukprot:XP_002125331.1 tubulin-specific chaperone C-like [Ciona intestinalis]
MSNKPAESMVIGGVDHDKRMAKIIQERLEDRNESRVLNLQQKHKEEESEKVTEEKSDFFTQNFEKEAALLEEMLLCNGIEKTDRLLVVDHFDAITASFSRLQKFFSDSIMFLPKYKSRKAKSQLTELQAKIDLKRVEMIPKKKFAFKSKSKKAERKTEPDVETTSKPVKTAGEIMMAKLCKEFQVKDKMGETIEMNENEINQCDVSISNLKNCTVRLRGAPGTVHISDVQECVISIGPVSGSVFVDRCTDSRIATGCQQLRVHHTKRTDFYLHVTSRAIIEDTTEIRVTPYNLNYSELDSHFKLSGLDQSTNNWQNVDDFNWLAMSTPSPNWSVLDKNEQKVEW